MITHTAELLYSARATLGEGPVWDDRIQKLWWVDIVNERLHQFDPQTNENLTFEIGTPVGFVALEENKEVVLGIKEGLARYSTTSKKLESIADIKHSNPSIRFNDGKCDPQGRLWGGTIAEDGTAHISKLYCLDIDGSLTTKLDELTISNGMAWNKNGDKMYFIDTPTQNIVEYEFDSKTGNISSPRIVIEIPSKQGGPDGMTIDEEDMLWVALWGGGKVVRIDPKDGSQLCEVIVPNVSHVTSCAFGGEKLDTLFITTATQDLTDEQLAAEPEAGSLFSVNVGVTGVSAEHFKG